MGERTFQTETNAWNQTWRGRQRASSWEQQAIQLDWKNRGHRHRGLAAEVDLRSRPGGPEGTWSCGVSPSAPRGTESCQFPD